MSYIQEALKKAQRKRDALYERYSGIFSAKGEEPSLFSRRAILWMSLLVVIIFLAFVSFLWLNSRTEQIPATNGHKYKKPVIKENTNVKELYVKAKHFHKTGRIKDALRLYQEVLRADPGHIEALNNLGVVYMLEKDYQAARVSLEKAIRLRPGYADPYYNMACLYSLQGNVAPGLAYLKKAVSLNQSVKKWALEDLDLKTMRGVREFEEMMKD